MSVSVAASRAAVDVDAPGATAAIFAIAAAGRLTEQNARGSADNTADDGTFDTAGRETTDRRTGNTAYGGIAFDRRAAGNGESENGGANNLLHVMSSKGKISWCLLFGDADREAIESSRTTI